MNNVELIKYSEEHIFYEIEMFYLSAIEELPKESKFYSNIIIESFVIHLRNLITFLYPTSHKENTDVCAEDFFLNKKEWINICPLISDSLNDYRIRANKEMGHLTLSRIYGILDSKKSWARNIIVKEIFVLLKLFCDNADKNKLNKNVVTIVSNISIKLHI